MMVLYNYTAQDRHWYTVVLRCGMLKELDFKNAVFGLLIVCNP